MPYNIKLKIQYELLWKKHNQINILNEKETVVYLKKNKASICRFGDGELSFVLMYYGLRECGSRFQQYDEEMGKRMAEILQGSTSKCLVALPSTIFSRKGTNTLTSPSKSFWRSLFICNIDEYLSVINQNIIYGDAYFTRFYITRKDKKNAPDRLSLIKQLWSNANLLIVDITSLLKPARVIFDVKGIVARNLIDGRL